jgi:hypothetical protein
MRLTRMATYMFAVVSCAFTAVVFLNTYEVVWNKDIVVAHSIQRVAAQSVIDTAVREFAAKADNGTDDVADLGGISGFEIPALAAQVHVEESRKVNGQWYERLSSAHYIGLNKNADGVVVDYLLYASKSWRSLPSPERIEQGMEIKVTGAKGATSVFVVAEKSVLPLDRSLIVGRAEGRQLLLVVDDARAGVYYGYSLVLKK